MPIQSIKTNDAKRLAKSLRRALATRNISFSHSECLDVVAQQCGLSDWNTFAAKLTVEENCYTTAKTDQTIPQSTSASSHHHHSDRHQHHSDRHNIVPWAACSFCNKSRSEVQSLIGGCGDWAASRAQGGPERSNVFICNECVKDCAELYGLNAS